MKCVSLLIAIILIQFVQLSAQSVDLKTEVEKRRSAAMKRLSTIAYRRSEVTEDFSSQDGPLEVKYEYTTTFLPPKSSHIIRRITRGTDLYLSEDIYMEGVRYFRKNNDKWEKEAYSGDRFTMNWSVSDAGTAVESKGNIDIGGKKAHLFVITRTTISGGSTDRSVEQLWFGSNGLLLKSTSEGGIGQGTIYRKEVTTYEYNVAGPRIKAPIK